MYTIFMNSKNFWKTSDPHRLVLSLADKMDIRRSDKFKNPKMSYMFNETLVLSIICDKCSSINNTTFKEEQSIKILNILGLVNKING